LSCRWVFIDIVVVVVAVDAAAVVVVVVVVVVVKAVPHFLGPFVQVDRKLMDDKYRMSETH